MIIFFLLMIIIFGWKITDFLIKNITVEEKFGLSFILGIGFHSIIYFLISVVFNFLPIRSSILILFIETVFLLIIFNIFKIKINRETYGCKVKKISHVELILILISILVLGYTALQNFYWPPYASDSVHLFDFRAKRLLAEDLSGFFYGAKYIHSENYPPFTSLLHFFFYDAGLTNPKSVYTFLFISFYLVIFGYVKRISKNRLLGFLAATLTILTPSVWWNSIISMTNIPYMEYVSLAILYSHSFIKNKKKYHGWLLSIILLGLSTFIRQEPIWFPILCFNIFYLIKNKKYKKAVLSVIIFTLLSSIWPMTTNWIMPAKKIINQGSFLTQTIYDLSTTKNLYFLKNYINDEILFPTTIVFSGMKKSWGMVFPLFSLILFGQVVTKKEISRLQIFILFFIFSIWIGFISFSKQFPGWSSLGDAISRMVIILIPLFWVSITLSPLWKIFKKRKKYEQKKIK